MAAKFIIMPGAKEFILNQSDSIFIKLQPRLASGGCSTPKIITAPAVFIGKPQSEEDSYNISEINQVKVYIHNALASDSSENVFRVDMETTLFGKRLMVGGFHGGTCDNCNNCDSCGFSS